MIQLSNVILHSVIIVNVILIYLVKELWKSNKNKDEIIRLQDNYLKENKIYKKY
jgi:hypothetical protein